MHRQGSSPTSHRELWRREAAFTLVELLVVMGIIAILLAAMLPAMRGLSGSANRHGAVGTLIGVLDRARAMSLSDGVATYVVFAVPTSTSDGRLFKPDLQGRAYAIYEERDNVAFVLEQRTAWTSLPNNLAFKVSDGGGTFASVTNQPLVRPAGSSGDPLFPVSSGVLASGANATNGVLLPYWKFEAGGSVMIPSYTNPNNNQYFRLLIFPGNLDASGNEVFTQKSASGSITSLLEEIDINSATGRAKYIINPANNLATPTPTPST